MLRSCKFALESLRQVFRLGLDQRGGGWAVEKPVAVRSPLRARQQWLLAALTRGGGGGVASYCSCSTSYSMLLVGGSSLARRRSIVVSRVGASCCHTFLLFQQQGAGLLAEQPVSLLKRTTAAHQCLFP